MSKMEKTGYLSTLKKAIRLDLTHPKHQGVTMQAHHLLSADAFAIAKVVPYFKGLGYDINAVENLVFIPSTLQGACHLETQLHRGNHGSIDEEAADDDDDEHPDSYHVVVAKILLKVTKKLRADEACQMSAKLRAEKAQKKLDVASRKVMQMINLYQVHLASIASLFSNDVEKFKNAGRGCSGVDSVPDANLTTAKCEVSRNHCGQRGKKQRVEKIIYAKQTYKLKVGR